MSHTHALMKWDDLVVPVRDAKYGKIRITQRDDDDMSSTDSEASKHSHISRYNVTPRERKLVRGHDHRLCFITNAYSHTSEVAHVLDSSNAGNRNLVDALRGLGVVHENFNLADISNLILLSRDMHYLWDKYATFVIVPSQATRTEMIRILDNDRRRIDSAFEHGHAVYPRQLPYPEVVTYDIILFQPSLFGKPGWLFPRAETDKAKPVYYTIPEKSSDPQERQEYLRTLDKKASVREFQNIRHITDRPGNEAVNPYLMAMNASQKLQYWEARVSGGFTADPVAQAALQECLGIMDYICEPTGASINLNGGDGDRQADTDEYTEAEREDRMDSEEDENMEDDMDDTTPPSNPGNRGPPGEPHSPVGLRGMNVDSSVTAGAKRLISHDGLDKASSIENWRREVRAFLDVPFIPAA